MKHSKRILPLFFLAASVAQADSLTLNAALQSAGVDSPQIQMASSASNGSYWKKVESRSAFLPKITGQVNYLTDYKYMLTNVTLPGSTQDLAIPNIIPTTIYTVNAQWNIFDGFASTNRFRAARMNETASGLDLDWAKFQVQRQVTLQFYRALAAKTLKEVAEANLKTLQDHLHEIKLFKKSGMSTNYDVLRVEVQVSEANSEVLNAADNVDTAEGHLGELLGRQGSVEPKGELPVPPAQLIEGKNLSMDRADLTADADRSQALDFQRRAASVHWIPKIGVFGQYNYYNNLNDRFSDWRYFRNAYEFGFNLTWDLFDGFASTAKTREVAAEQQQTEKSIVMKQLKAQQDVALWTRKYRYYQSVFSARQSDIGKAKESVRLAREGRRVGSRTNTDLLDAETDLYRSRAGAVNAQLGLIESLINLELATGKKLYDF